MPANLSPQYFDAEKRLREATTPEEKRAIMEEMLSIIPKHKGTEKLQAMLKTKIAKLKSVSQKKSATAKHGQSITIKKSGAGQVVIIGPPNSGKSSLIKYLTNATPVISNNPFSTQVPYPAMMKYKNIQIQLIDTPPVTPEYIDVRHYELIRVSDGVVILLDLSTADSLGMLNLLLNKLKEKSIEIIGEEREPPSDGFMSNKKAIITANKNDLAIAFENIKLIEKGIPSGFRLSSISTFSGSGLENLKERIFLMLNIVRVYSKVPGKKIELTEPYTLKKGSTVSDMARAVHKDFTQKLKYARIWSENKYKGQQVNRDYVLEDEDIIELHV